MKHKHGCLYYELGKVKHVCLFLLLSPTALRVVLSFTLISSTTLPCRSVSCSLCSFTAPSCPDVVFLSGGLFACFVVWLAGCFLSLLFGWLVDLSVGWLLSWLVIWLSGCLIDWLSGWLTGWLVDRLDGCLVIWLAGLCLVGWLSGWLVDWLFDWLVDWLAH